MHWAKKGFSGVRVGGGEGGRCALGRAGGVRRQQGRGERQQKEREQVVVCDGGKEASG